MENTLLLGFLGSLVAGLLTAVGALPVLLGKTPSRGFRDLALGFAAGVMLAFQPSFPSRCGTESKSRSRHVNTWKKISSVPL